MITLEVDCKSWETCELRSGRRQRDQDDHDAHPPFEHLHYWDVGWRNEVKTRDDDSRRGWRDARHAESIPAPSHKRAGAARIVRGWQI
jgi:hypothetical protein